MNQRRLIKYRIKHAAKLEGRTSSGVDGRSGRGRRAIVEAVLYAVTVPVVVDIAHQRIADEYILPTEVGDAGVVGLGCCRAGGITCKHDLRMSHLKDARL